MARVHRAADPLFGRGAELEAIRLRLARSHAGRCEVVLVEGEPGIGKTRLLEESIRLAADVCVFTARADPLEQTRPFGPLSDALACRRSAPDPVRAEIALLIDEGAAEFRVIERVAELVERLGLEGPTVVAIDDLQWADRSTLRCLRHCIRQVGDVPVAFLLALRAVPRDDELSLFLELSIREGAELCELGPLDDENVAALLESRLGAPPGPQFRVVLQSAAGNPFFVNELIDALAAEGRVRREGSCVDVDDAPIPQRFGTSLLRYLQFLTVPGLSVLRRAAVLGSRFSLAELAAFAEVSPLDLVPIIEQARRARILTESDDELGFRHDLLREAIYLDMPVTVRRSLHLEAGRALARTAAAPMRVAEHFMLGAEPGDEGAVEWLVAAAAVAVNQVTRAELLTRAVELVPGTDARLGALGAEAVAALTGAGRPADAEALANQLRPRLDAAGTARLAVGLAAASNERGDPRLTLQHVATAKRHSYAAPRIQAELLAHEALALIYMGQGDRGATLAARAIEEGRRAGAPLAIVIGQESLSLAALCEGRGRDALALARDAVEHRPAGVPQAVPETNLQMALVQEDELAEAEELFRVANDRCVEQGHVTPRILLVLFHAIGLLVVGRLDEARAEAEACVALCDALASPFVATAARGVIARVALYRDDVAEAEAALGPLPPPVAGADWNRWSAALVHEARGAHGAALELLRSTWDGFGTLRYFVSWVSLGPDLVRFALRLDDRGLAEAVACDVAVGAAGSASPSASGAALRCRGLINSDPDMMLEAVDTYARGPRVLETAAAREDAASLLGNAEAVGQLTAALTTYDAVHASGDAARVRAALRARGIRLGARGDRGRPATGWESLTPTERHVAELAADGLTSREIGSRLYISTLTVGSHIRSIYRKLGINSRVQLANATNQQRDLTSE